MNLRKLMALVLVGGALAIAAPATAMARPVNKACVRIHGRGALQSTGIQLGYCP